MAFGYPTIIGANNLSQYRRSVDMIYQRGATYDVTLTGTTYEDSMELVVDMYNKDVKVGQMSIVPYDVSLSGGTYYYQFGIRPYDYMSNYIESEHYTKYPYSSFTAANLSINVNRTQYKNITRANYKYGYRYYSGNTLVTEYTGNTPTNDFQHTWNFFGCNITSPSINIYPMPNGQYFDYIGGQFQMDEHLILPNYDQELGSALQVGGVGLDMTLTTDYERNYSPASQFIFSYPRTPYQSEVSRFLTDAPRIQYVTENDSYSLYYLMGQTGDRKVIEADFVLFRFYNENNELLSSYNTQLVTSGSTYGAFRSPTGYTDTLDIWTLPVGPADIPNVYADNFGLTSAVAYYTVQICGGYPTNNALRVSTGPVVPVSEMFYFYLTDNCLPQDTRVVWLNNRGGYDYYTFTAYRQDTKKISRQTYDNRQYQTNPNSPDRNIGRTIKTFATDVEQEIVLESDFLTLADGNWIEQLFYSPQVYIMKRDYISQIGPESIIYKDLTPTQVLSTEVETITKKHQKLNKYKITMKVANNFFVNKGF
jgi:hypothetical protein